MLNLLSHINPDGDAIGSLFAAYYLIKDGNFLEKDPQVYLFGDRPRWFDAVHTHLHGPAFVTTPAPAGPCWLLDAPSLSRCGKGSIAGPQDILLLLDHHPVGDAYQSAEFVYVNTEASSACELLANLAFAKRWYISPEAASWLALGIRTDTLSFATDSTRARTHDVMADLIRAGADTTDVSRIIHKSMTRELLQFQSLALSNAYWRGDAVVIVVDRAFRQRFGVGESDTKAILYATSQLVDVDLTVLVNEADDGATLVSTRSTTHGRAQQVAIVLGGGGHPQASGARVEDTIGHVLDRIWTLI